jgi:hypothetical protein
MWPMLALALERAMGRVLDLLVAKFGRVVAQAQALVHLSGLSLRKHMLPMPTWVHQRLDSLC